MSDSREGSAAALESQRDNDPYASVERAATVVWSKVQSAIANGEANRISDAAVATLLTAAIKLYAQKTDCRTFRPLLGVSDEIVTPTEALTAVTEILRALRLGPVEFGLWSHRRHADYHNVSDPPVEPWRNEEGAIDNEQFAKNARNERD